MPTAPNFQRMDVISDVHVLFLVGFGENEYSKYDKYVSRWRRASMNPRKSNKNVQCLMRIPNKERAV